jgi:DNA adenine methylase
MTSRVSATRPLLRWAGSKRKLLPKLIPYWSSDFGRYIEPFVGSGALFYALAPRTAVLSDLNGELIDALTTTRNRPNAVYDVLESLPRGKDSYYALRSLDASTLLKVERAARFLFLNRYCFNGLYRTDQMGRFNVPFGATKTGDIPDRATFLRSASMLKRATLLNDDFESVIDQHVESTDFVYLDPPYAVDNRRIFKQYGPQTFGTDDLHRVKRCLETIEARGAKFVLSYAYCAEALRTFKEWTHRKVYCQRNISGFVKHRRRAAELVVTNCEWGK